MKGRLDAMALKSKGLSSFLVGTGGLFKPALILFLVGILLWPQYYFGAEAQSLPTEEVQENSNEVVEIPDENLEQAILDKLDEEEGYQITVSDLEGMTGILWANNMGIYYIKGLEHAVNLHYLYLQENYIDTSEGSESMQIIESLEDEGVNVTYFGQKCASIDPTEVDYFIDDPPADVSTEIDWNETEELLDVTGEGIEEDDWDLDGDTLSICTDFIENFEAGTELEFDLIFDAGPAIKFRVNVLDTTYAQIYPTETEFDLYDPADVQTTITWNDANKVEKVTGEDLEEGDWWVDNSTLSISADFLQGFEKGDALEFTISFDKGGDAALEVNIIDTEPHHAIIDPTETVFTLYDPADVQTTITWNDADEVEEVTGEGIEEADWAVEEVDEETATLIIEADFFEDFDIGDKLKFDISFDVGENAVLEVDIVEKAIIDPAEAIYDLYYKEDVKTTINWNIASKVEEVTGEGIGKADWWVEDSTLTISAGFLQTFAEGEELVFTIKFDEGADATLKIEVIDTTPGGPGSGDVTGDGKVGIQDTLAVLNYVVGSTDFTEEQKLAADVNEDEKVDVLDAVIILRYVVGLVDSLPV